MATMLEKMRARLKERDTRNRGNDALYIHWKMPFGNSSTVRLLPYNDPFTDGFWAEKVMLPMQFTDPNNEMGPPLLFRAPCREMYEPKELCPVLVPVRELYAQEKDLRNSGATKDADALKRIAGSHWKKPTYYYQGFVIKSGFPEESEPENPIRVFPYNKQIHQMIYSSIIEAEEDSFDRLPTGEFTMDDVQALLDGGDVDMSKFEGYNYILKKGKRGEYADWTVGSTWARTATTLDEVQLAALAEHGMHDLTKHLPDRPTEEQYAVLAEMMQVSVNRQLTGENGFWKSEWEEAGFKPIKSRNAKPAAASTDGDGDDAPKASSSAPKASGSSRAASDALDRLRAKRGKGGDEAPAETAEADAPTEEPAEETPAEVAAAADDTPAPAESGVSDLAAKIKARVGKTA